MYMFDCCIARTDSDVPHLAYEFHPN